MKNELKHVYPVYFRSLAGRIAAQSMEARAVARQIATVTMRRLWELARRLRGRQYFD